MHKSLYSAILLAFFLCLGLMTAGLITRPIFPVDETRYLTVAWEMYQSGNWILPTLNGEAYHHKPPILFWLINILWSVFGVSQQIAMTVPFIAAFLLLVLTARLATRLFPDNQNAPLLSVAILGGSLPFVLYSNMIMFDLMLGVAVIFGVSAIIDFFRTRKNKHILFLALAVGAGLLIKGPAVLLHMAPVLLLVKYWMGVNAPRLREYLPKILLGLLMGVAIAMCWAIPAAIQGGSEFTQKIFYGQTTGRIVNAFDHQRPIYWYIMFVPLFVLPWALSPALWRGLKAFITDKLDTSNKRLLLSWVGSIFIAFSLISGKQVHYLLPLMTPIALIMTAGFLRIGDNLRRSDVLPILFGAGILAIIPILLNVFAAELVALEPKSVHMEEAFANLNIIPVAMIGLSILGLGFFLNRNNIGKSIAVISIAMMLLMGGFQFAAQSGIYPKYNLTNTALELQKYNDKPLAFAGTYHGQFGFLARLDTPLDVINVNQINEWFANNNDGLVILYTKNPEDFKMYEIVCSAPYRLANYFLIIKIKY